MISHEVRRAQILRVIETQQDVQTVLYGVLGQQWHDFVEKMIRRGEQLAAEGFTEPDLDAFSRGAVWIGE